MPRAGQRLGEAGHVLHDFPHRTHFSHGDDWEDAVWITAGSKQAYVIAGGKNTREYGASVYPNGGGANWNPGGEYYGEPQPHECNIAKGYHGGPYIGKLEFYDVTTLGQAADGSIASYDPAPYASFNFEAQRYANTSCAISSQFGGIAYDNTNHVLYVAELRADGTAKRPVIHAFQVDTAASSTDTTPPTVPSALHTTTVDGSGVSLAWTASTDVAAPDGIIYIVYRDPVDQQPDSSWACNCGPYGNRYPAAAQSIAMVKSGTAYTDSLEIVGGATYSYSVAAMDVNGNLSAKSSAVSATIPNTGPARSGWGSTTMGGYGQTVYHVTNTNDSGAGSLRSGLSAGNRHIVFDVGGTWHPASRLVLAGANVTIDGSTAPSPGVTIEDYSLRLEGSAVHDVIITNIRSRNPTSDSEPDNITIKNGVYNVVLDHVSTDSPSDGNIDITGVSGSPGTGSHDITVQFSILSNGTKAMLTNYGTYHVSLHNNLWINEQYRNPNTQYQDAATSVSPNVVTDVLNNVIWNWGDSGGGSIWQCGGTGNDVKNYYYSGATTPTRKANGIVNDHCSGGTAEPSFYTTGNFSGDDSSAHLNSMGNHTTRFSAPAITGETTACLAATALLTNVGALPLDATDSALVAGVTLPGC